MWVYEYVRNQRLTYCRFTEITIYTSLILCETAVVCRLINNLKMIGLVMMLALLHVSSPSRGTAGYGDTSVQRFQKYVQIKTTTHSNLTEGVEFWRHLAKIADVPISVYEYVVGYPIVVLKWAGTDSSQKSIMLNSHMDVVPAAAEDGWTHDPFSGYIDANGNIYGRGTQDMKSVSIQYYEAQRRLKNNNITFPRDVYMTIMPDEEVGGGYGMIPFLKSHEFAAMNVGIVLDEGAPLPLDTIALFYQDKVVWQIQVDCYGVSAHGSTFPMTNNTATGKCRNVIDRFFAFRDEQYEISKRAPLNFAGEYTSVNLNRMSAGTANNVIPGHVSLVFDMRLGTTVVEEEFNATLHEWIAEAGDNITLTYIIMNRQSPATVANSSNPYYNAISSATSDLGLTILPMVPPGSTDARHLRSAGYPAFGFSPMPNTSLLLHSVDERLNVKTLMRGRAMEGIRMKTGLATCKNVIRFQTLNMPSIADQLYPNFLARHCLICMNSKYNIVK